MLPLYKYLYLHLYLFGHIVFSHHSVQMPKKNTNNLHKLRPYVLYIYLCSFLSPVFFQLYLYWPAFSRKVFACCLGVFYRIEWFVYEATRSQKSLCPHLTLPENFHKNFDQKTQEILFKFPQLYRYGVYHKIQNKWKGHFLFFFLFFLLFFRGGWVGRNKWSLK